MLEVQRSYLRRGSMALTWFARLWAIAAVAHVVGNPRIGQVVPEPTLLGITSLCLGIAAVALFLRPESRVFLTAVAALTLATVWFEAPVIGNHWLLAGFVSVALLLALPRSNPYEWFAPTGRWLLLGFYSFAAFAKVNTGFFDATASCALVYTNQGLAAAGLPTIPAGSVVALGLAVATAVIELSIPVLLLVPGTRRWGVLLGAAFHTLISFDLGQHFYDFTAVLFPLFGLFLPDHDVAELESGRRLRPVVATGIAGILGLFVVVTVLPASAVTVALLTRAWFVVWVPLALWIVWRLATVRVVRPDVSLELPGVAAALLVALVVFNGLTPYFEIKTATGWNMYGNLLTADGESNHLLVRRTYPLTDGNRDPVTILESSDPGLAAYVDSGYALPGRQFRDYLALHPTATVTFVQAGERATGTGAELGEERSVWARKFQMFRAIDTERPVRCQLFWLPAG